MGKVEGDDVVAGVLAVVAAAVVVVAMVEVAVLPELVEAAFKVVVDHVVVSLADVVVVNVVVILDCLFVCLFSAASAQHLTLPAAAVASKQWVVSLLIKLAIDIINRCPPRIGRAWSAAARIGRAWSAAAVLPSPSPPVLAALPPPSSSMAVMLQAASDQTSSRSKSQPVPCATFITSSSSLQSRPPTASQTCQLDLDLYTIGFYIGK